MVDLVSGGAVPEVTRTQVLAHRVVAQQLDRSVHAATDLVRCLADAAKGARLEIAVEAFEPLPRRARSEVEGEGERICACRGADTVEVRLD